MRPLRRNISWDSAAWDAYMEWLAIDRVIHARINMLVKECRTTPFMGLGKPEPLKHEYHGYWSRRINDEHRLVYRVSDEAIHILHCRGHYQKKK